MKPFRKRHEKKKFKAKVTWLANSPVPITDLARTPAAGAAVTVEMTVEVAGESAAAALARAVSCPPDIADNVNKPGVEAGLEGGTEEVSGGGEALAVLEEHQDFGDETGGERAVSEHGGRPPQLGDVEPQQPRPNPNNWVRVKRRLVAWRLACHDQCGRVCAVRRQK